MAKSHESAHVRDGEGFIELFVLLLSDIRLPEV